MFILPTRNRLGNLKRFVSAAREMGTRMPGLVVVNQDDWDEHKEQYERLKGLFPENWDYKIVTADCYGEAVRQVWSTVEHGPWIGLVSDDLVPSTANWDEKLVSRLRGWNVVYSNDGWQAPARMHGAIVWSGDLARAVGYIFPPKLKHIFHDDLWETLGRETGCAHPHMDIMCKHLHESLEGIRGPSMDPTSDLWKHDEAVFKEWLATEKDATVARIRALMERRGVKALKADYTGMKVMIGVPSIDGKYESNFVISLYKTFDLFKTNGVPCQFAEEKYTADIAYGRSKLLAAFLRSGCTHFLMIDADMGWGEDAIVRLVYAKKDFVAIAGPKKRYPISFAANYTDDDGHPINLSLDTDSGTMEVGEIGMAFCLITRGCAEKMTQAYPELQYTGVTQEAEWGLFIPMIHKGRWYSEDFAFCKRWRMIGGHCHFVPDVALSHTGSHTFTGSFSQTVQQQLQQDVQMTKLEAAD